MNKTKKILAPAIAFVLVIACLFGLNSLTAPVIQANSAASLMGPLADVLPGYTNLEQLDFSDLPETVNSIFKDSKDAGYSAKLVTTQGYTGNPIELALGVSSEGKISGLQITEFQDTRDVTDEFIASFVEKDSALAGVDLVSGATFSSSAIKNAVADALNYMADNGMITAGVKSASQVFTEMLPSIFPGIANAQGILQLTEESTEDFMAAVNGSGAAAIVESDGESFLQIVNINGDVKTLDVTGNEVEKNLCEALSSLSFNSTADVDEAKIKKLAGKEAVLEEIPLTGVFNCVTSAFKITTPDGSYYGFGTRPYAYSNELMPVYFMIGEDGAIAKMTAPEFILYSDYFSQYELDKKAYKAGFEGVTADSFSDDICFISGATMSSEAISMATKAAFDAFSVIAEG